MFKNILVFVKKHLLSIEILGYFASACLALCALPQAYKSLIVGNTGDVSAGMLWLWLLGEVGMLLYTIFKIGFDKPLIINYTVNILLLMIIFYYLYFPRGGMII